MEEDGGVVISFDGKWYRTAGQRKPRGLRGAGMGNELTNAETGGQIVSVLNNQGLGEVLKPLIREIHLFDTYVAGTTHLPDLSVLEESRVDDWLGLMREENKFDDNAEYEEYERLLMDRDQLKKEAGQIRTRWRRT